MCSHRTIHRILHKSMPLLIILTLIIVKQCLIMANCIVPQSDDSHTDEIKKIVIKNIIVSQIL